MAGPYSYFPATYQPGVNPYLQAAQQQLQQMQQPQTQIQNGGFVRVKSEQDVIDYPLAPGYTMTFIDEGATHCYTKTMGFNQFERPKIDKYRLVREEVAEDAEKAREQAQTVNLDGYVRKAEFEPILGKIEAMEKELAALTKPKRTKEAKEDAAQ